MLKRQTVEVPYVFKILLNDDFVLACCVCIVKSRRDAINMTAIPLALLLLSGSIH